MKKALIGFALAALLSGCGTLLPKPTANLGVSIGTDGIKPSASVGVKQGPLSVNWGMF